jgi:hypothetical protein
MSYGRQAEAESILARIARRAEELGLSEGEEVADMPDVEPMTEAEWAEARKRAERDLPVGDRVEAE